MSYKITVTHTQESLFDFLLYHTYSRASGFLINVLGFAVSFLVPYSWHSTAFLCFVLSLTCLHLLRFWGILHYS